MSASTTTAASAQHAPRRRPASPADITTAAGGAGGSAPGGGGLPAPIAAPAGALPPPGTPDAFLAACNEFAALEEASWATRAPNGDYLDHGLPAIAERQAPLLDLICDTPVAGRIEYQRARARLFCALDGGGGDDDEIDNPGAARIARAIIRDADALANG